MISDKSLLSVHRKFLYDVNFDQSPPKMFVKSFEKTLFPSKRLEFSIFDMF